MCALPVSRQTYSYSAYGLGLHSVLPLPAALQSDGIADVQVRRVALPEITAGLAVNIAHARVTARETHLFLPQIGTFVVREGREILVDPDPRADADLLQLAILGPVVAALLQQQGCLILHASAVEIEGAAVGFLGTRGAGKSTMAAAMHARGYPLLADDILAVRAPDAAPQVVPAFPQLKLWPDALVALGSNPDLLPRVRARYAKRAQRITQNFCARKGLPLACLYVLCGGDMPRVETLPPGTAFLEVVRHSYGIEWLYGVSGAEQFRGRSVLVQRIPVRRLERPPDLRVVPQLVDLVEANLGCR